MVASRRQKWDVDLKFEFEFKKKPQSVDRTKRPRSCVGSEPPCQKRQLHQETARDHTKRRGKGKTEKEWGSGRIRQRGEKGSGYIAIAPKRSHRRVRVKKFVEEKDGGASPKRGRGAVAEVG